MNADIDAQIENLIREIAVRNGVAVKKDDPIMIVYTMNNQLLEEGRKSQQEALAAFKSEIELIAHQWEQEATKKSEKILNAALSASKNAMNEHLAEGARRANSAITADIQKLNKQAEAIAKGARTTAIINLASALTLAAAFAFIFLLQ